MSPAQTELPSGVRTAVQSRAGEERSAVEGVGGRGATNQSAAEAATVAREERESESSLGHQGLGRPVAQRAQWPAK